MIIFPFPNIPQPFWHVGLKTKETPNEERNSFKGKVVTILTCIKEKTIGSGGCFAIRFGVVSFGGNGFKQRAWTHNRTEFVKTGK